MTRAWPFENRKERLAAGLRGPFEFVGAASGDTEAIVIRIGMNDAQLVLVDGDGAWDRWVYRSLEEAREVAESLGVAVNVGKYPEKTRLRMSSRPRTAEDFAAGAYPEQGGVGPVKPYPENRPRNLRASPTRESSGGEERPAAE